MISPNALNLRAPINNVFAGDQPFMHLTVQVPRDYFGKGLGMPDSGLPNSSEMVPVGRHNARAPVFILPTVTLSDLDFMRLLLFC